MKEDILHQVWKYKLYRHLPFQTEEGEAIEIIHPGLLNQDAGPDFFNAKIKINGTLWAGNVELHHKASDWIKHGHHLNPAFDNVILHVVLKPNGKTLSSKGREIPIWVMPLPKGLEEVAPNTFHGKGILTCSPQITKLSPMDLCVWSDRMLIERLQGKTTRIAAMLEQGFQHQDVFFVLLTRSFGFGLNSDAFEQLGRQTPWTLVKDLQNEPFLRKALLLGQAALLPRDNSRETRKLRQVYQSLQKQFGLTPLTPERWKRLRVRPKGFPEQRILQLTNFLQNDLPTPHTLGQTDHPNTLLQEWLPGPLSKNALQLLLINSAIPFLFALGWLNQQDALCQQALHWLESLPPENNRIMRCWKGSGIQPKTAADSQALLHLFRHYCSLNRCLHCRIGHLLLAKT